MLNVRGQRARRREWANQVKLTLAFERGLTSKLRRELKATFTRAAEMFRDSRHVDIEKAHYHRLVSIVRPYERAIFKTFWQRLRLEISKSVTMVEEVKYTEDQLDIETEDYIRKVAYVRMTDVSRSTARKVADVIASGHDAEKSAAEIADDIEALGNGEISESRARTIARTELHSASQAGAQASAEDLDIPGLRKEWLTVADSRVRPDHADADGQTVDLEDNFTVGGEELSYPGDPSASPENTINCRCVVSYTTDKE